MAKNNADIVQWCLQCTLWKESQEHDITAAAPPETELAPDENGGFYSKGYVEEEEGNHYYDPEAGDGYDDEDYDYRVGLPANTRSQASRKTR